jgi:hypothetical protein
VILFHGGLTMLIVWFVMRGNTRVDYRIVFLAALLPDAIDKPIGRILFRSKFGTGRLWMHTLLVNLALFCVVFFLRGRIKRQFVLVPISSLLHIAEDAVWSTPKVFWWPLFGTVFPRDTTKSLLGIHWREGLIEEGVGVLVLAWLLASHRMLSRDGLRTFLKTGMLEQPREALK